MTNPSEFPDINKKLLEMDDGEVAAEGSPDFEPAGNEVGAEDLSNGMSGDMQPKDVRFRVEEDLQVH